MDDNAFDVKKNKNNNDFIATCVIYMIALLLFVGLRIASGLGWFDKMSGEGAELVFSFLSQIVIMFLIPVVGFKIYNKKRTQQGITFAEFSNIHANNQSSGFLRSWGFNKPSGRIIAFAFLLGLVMFFFNLFVSGFFNGILSIFGYRFPSDSGDAIFTGVGGFLVMIVIVAVLPGICEETAHRGLLLKNFVPRIGVMRAIAISSLMFGLMHLNIVQCIYAMVLGYLMATAALATRTIWTAVIMHFMNNALSVYLSYATAYGWFGGDILLYINSFVGISFLIYIGVSVLLYMAVVALIHKFARENYIKDRTANNNDNTAIVIPRYKGMSAIKYYLTAEQSQKPEPLRPLEKTFLTGIIFLGTVITGMTLYWGLFL